MVACGGSDQGRTWGLPRRHACCRSSWHPMSMHGSCRDSSSGVHWGPRHCQRYARHGHEGRRREWPWNEAHERLSAPHPRRHTKRRGWERHAWSRHPWHPRWPFVDRWLVQGIALACRPCSLCRGDGPHDSVLVNLHHHRLHLHTRRARGSPAAAPPVPGGLLWV